MANNESSGPGFEEVLFVIVILAGLAIAWFVAGGPEKAAKKGEGPFLLSPVDIRSPSSLSPLVNLQGEGYREEVESTSQDVARINDELAKAQAAGERSPLYGQVAFAQSTAGLGGGSASEEYVVVRAAKSNTGPITISGFVIKSAITGRSATIPRGTRIPITGSVNDEEPVALAPGQEAVIATGRSPIGVSFRENLCIGYLSQFQSFSPSLPLACPRPDAEITYAQRSLGNDNRCLNFLEGMPRCRIQTEPFPDDLESECRNFITSNITYNGCTANHRNEPSFLGSTWRLYLRYDQPFWRDRREVLKLLDENGKTVDTFTY